MDADSGYPILAMLRQLCHQSWEPHIPRTTAANDFKLMGTTIQMKNCQSLKPQTTVHSLAIPSFMVPCPCLYHCIYIYIHTYGCILCPTPMSAGCSAIYCWFHREKPPKLCATLPDVCTIRMPHSGYAPTI